MQNLAGNIMRPYVVLGFECVDAWVARAAVAGYSLRSDLIS